MAININNDVNNAQIGQTTKNKQTSQTGQSGNANTNNIGSQATDTISLTDSAKLIHTLEKQLENIPVVDATKVAQVRENINSGNHTISSDIIAAKFLQYEAQLSKAV